MLRFPVAVLVIVAAAAFAVLTKASPKSFVCDDHMTAIVRRNVRDRNYETVRVENLNGLEDYQSIVVTEWCADSLEEDAVIDLPGLREFGMAGVGLLRLEPGCFRNLPNLSALYLMSNSLEELAPKSFAHLPVRELNLNDNRLSLIHPDAFDDMPRLARIELAGNKLTRIDPNWFKGSADVEVIRLAGNLVEEVPDDAFANIGCVTAVELSGNRVHTVRPHAFRNLGRLVRLDMSRNRIAALPDDAFRDSAGLRVLVLIGNEIRCLSEEVLESLANATAVNLILNRIDERCRGRLHRFVQAHPHLSIHY